MPRTTVNLLEQGLKMPLFMDRHRMQDTSPEQIAIDHLKDVEVQEKYGANFFTYFYDYPSQSVCCLVEAPSMDAVLAAHREVCGADGLEDMPTDIIEVNYGSVEAFLGRIRSPQPGEVWDEIAFRTIVWVKVANAAALIQRLGDATAAAVIREHLSQVRDAITSAGGREVTRAGIGLMASFTSAGRAVESAIGVQQLTASHNREQPEHAMQVKAGINAGEPVTDHGELFGAAVQLAEAACDAAADGRVVVTGVVRDLCLGKPLAFTERENLVTPGPADSLRVYDVAWSPVSPTPAASSANPDGLSGREIEVLRLIAAGKSNQQVAEDLVISINTAIRHVSNIYTKAGLCNRAEAASYAHAQGLV